MARTTDGSASHRPAQDTTRNRPDNRQHPSQMRPGTFPRDGISGPLQGLRQLQPRQSVAIADRV